MTLEQIDRDVYIERVFAPGLLAEFAEAARLHAGASDGAPVRMQLGELICLAAVVAARRAFPSNVREWGWERSFVNDLTEGIDLEVGGGATDG